MLGSCFTSERSKSKQKLIIKPYKHNTKYNLNEVDTEFIYTELMRKIY